MSILIPAQRPVQAFCYMCPVSDVVGGQQAVISDHIAGEAKILTYITQDFLKHQVYLATTYYTTIVKPALQAFTMQMTAMGQVQLGLIGGFFDAKQQLETQRLLQELQVQAHKDYQPSREFCYFGTNVRSLAASEQLSNVNALALDAQSMARHLGKAGTASAISTEQANDKVSRWNQFKERYCDIRDNNWTPDDENSGLTSACGTGATDKARVNNDIDYTRMIDSPRTLDVAFYENKAAPSPTEEDVVALGNNLFGNTVLSRNLSGPALNSFDNQKLYMALRSVAAKRNVGENSFNAIVGLKSSGSKTGAAGQSQTRAYLGAIMQELGVPDQEVFSIIGEDPSYYAQLEILAKKIYQTPNFFADLYDKPANVERKSVALKAIELMLDRAIYESQLRQEMSMSVLLSSKLQPQFEAISTRLSGVGE